MAALLVSTATIGCGSSSPVDDPPADPPDATSPDAPPGIDQGEPIVAPAETWTFVPIEGTRCADGSPTGINVRLHPGSTELFIYMEGGGACASGPSCWGPNPGAKHVNGYGEAEFAAETKFDNFALFDPDPSSGNPYATMNLVMVPYCTGDVHSGSAIRELPLGNTTRTTYFVGARNMELILPRLAATFPALDRAFLLGTSAGGGGATFNYSKIRAALATTVHTVIDSAPGWVDDGDAAKYETWGIVPACPGCETVADVRAFNWALDPAARYAFLSFQFDPTTANGRSVELFATELAALRAEIAARPEAHSFVADNTSVNCQSLPNPERAPCHVITTRREPPELRAAMLRWLRAMASGEGWADVTVAPPS